MIKIETKICSKCGNEKDVSKFCKDKTRKDGYFPQCKECKNSDKKKYYNKNKSIILAKSAKYQKNNFEKIKIIKKRYRENHKEELKIKTINYYSDNHEKKKQKYSKYYTIHKVEILKKQEKYFRENPNKRKEIYNKFIRTHREEINKKSREQYHKNPEKHKNICAMWRKANPDKSAIYVNRRRNKKIKNGGNFTFEEWQLLKGKYNHECLCCGKKEPEIKLEMDHVIPISKGGINSKENIQPLCRSCNASKGVKIIDYRNR